MEAQEHSGDQALKPVDPSSFLDLQAITTRQKDTDSVIMARVLGLRMARRKTQTAKHRARQRSFEMDDRGT